MHILEITDGVTVSRVPFEGQPMLDRLLSGTRFLPEHPCGGRGICGKCAVDISGNVSGPVAREKELGVRLSCCVRLLGNAVLKVKSLPEMVIEGAGCTAVMPDESRTVTAAVDIGTTTIVMRILDSVTGEVLFSDGCRNPQRDIAADVIGRISAASQGRSAELRALVENAITGLAGKSGYREKIIRYVITGNTTMLYLLTGLSPAALGVAPFRAGCLFGAESVFDGRPAYLPRCIHAFSGADLTCAMLAVDLRTKAFPALLCDIGTNGELALYDGNQLYVTSVAAGPAFEGVGIRCGCAGVTGAISEVYREHDHAAFRTVGGAPAVGLCGSGVIDAAAYALNSGLADETGAMEEPLVLSGPVAFYPEDLRAVQTAKAAVAAGIARLLKTAGLKETDIKRFVVCGGFGAAMNPASAVRIGLFPACFLPVAEYAGNAALAGACRLLTDPDAAEACEKLTDMARHVDLGGDSEFNNLFIDHMIFPE